MRPTRRDLLEAAVAMALGSGCARSAVPGEATPRFAALTPDRIRERLPTGRAESDSFLLRAASAVSRSPDPIARIAIEGRMPGQPAYDRSVAALRDLPIALDLAVAWTLTQERRFLAAADRYLAAWTGAYRVTLNPIDEERFDLFLLAADLVRGHVAASTDAGVDHLARAFAEGYGAALLGPARRGSNSNNWASHRAKLAVLGAYALGEKAAIERARAAFAAQLGRSVVAADGEVVDFRERDALHYVVHNLQSLLVACHAAHAHGEDWLHREFPGGRRVRHGASLARAVDWLVPFAEGRKTHVEFVRSTVRFDAERTAAGVAGYSGPWDPGQSLDLFALAAALDPRFAPTAAHVQDLAGRPPAEWTRLFAS